jgi:hypothetical protein
MAHSTVCLSTANTLSYPQGGHLWVFINWALGLRACGFHVTWLDVVQQHASIADIEHQYAALRRALTPFGLQDSIAIDCIADEDCSLGLKRADLPILEERDSFELLVDLRYDLPRRIVSRFHRSILVDVDPGQLQLAIVKGTYAIPSHDVLFSIGENVGRLKWAQTIGREWLHTPPCVYLDEWPVVGRAQDAPWTTIAHWWGHWTMDEVGNGFPDGKRDAFLPYLGLPSRVRAPFELALNLGAAPEEKRMIEAHGFSVCDAHNVAATPGDYRRYVQRSAGEFSCAKPSYVRLNTGWISDRTLCYLASGKPCVVQYTGPNQDLPSEMGGLRRFINFDDAARCMEHVIDNYEAESQAARALAEQVFDSTKIITQMLSRADSR